MTYDGIDKMYSMKDGFVFVCVYVRYFGSVCPVENGSIGCLDV